MAITRIGVNDPKAVKKYSAALAVDTIRKSYFGKRFMGDENQPFLIRKDLEKDAGDAISYDLSLQLTQAPTEGDNILEGNEEALTFATDSLTIDQMRFGANAGGRMTRKRTLHDLRSVAKARLSDKWALALDELCFMYLSGIRGINADFSYPASYTGFAGNAFAAPDAQHHIFGGTALSNATITNADGMSLAVIDRLVAHAQTMGGGTQHVPRITPIDIEGGKHYVLVLHPYQVYQLRTNTAAGQWLDIQRALATAVGKESPLFTGALGMYNGVIIHEHQAIIRQSNGGVGANLPTARALFMGAQAGCIAFGSTGNGMRFDWNEETRDNGNQLVVTSSSIVGVKKTTFNGLDFGVMAIDTFAPPVV